MNEIHELDYKNQVINDIKKEFQNPNPYTERILKTLFDLRAKGISQQLSDSEFFDIVGETYKLNPGFFMKELYKTFIVKVGKIIGPEKRQEMEKYIIEKFCLAEDEQVLYGCKGNVKCLPMKMPSFSEIVFGNIPSISLRSGDIFLTNYRLITHGLLKTTGGDRKDKKNVFIESSSVFGYQFPFKNHRSLGFSIKTQIVSYFLKIDKTFYTISIKLTDKSKGKEDGSKIFDLLRKDANEVLDVIKEVMDWGITGISEKYKRRHIWGILRALRISEEFKDLSDSDYLNIIKETYKLEPEFFMSSIYPKMMTWDNSSFLDMKEQVTALLMKEGANVS